MSDFYWGNLFPIFGCGKEESGGEGKGRGGGVKRDEGMRG